MAAREGGGVLLYSSMTADSSSKSKSSWIKRNSPCILSKVSLEQTHLEKQYNVSIYKPPPPLLARLRHTIVQSLVYESAHPVKGHGKRKQYTTPEEGFFWAEKTQQPPLTWYFIPVSIACRDQIPTVGEQSGFSPGREALVSAPLRRQQARLAIDGS